MMCVDAKPWEADMTTISHTPATGTDETAYDPVDDKVMGLLHEHVPLSLIMDLVEPSGPDSAGILRTEGAPQSQWWVNH